MKTSASVIISILLAGNVHAAIMQDVHQAVMMKKDQRVHCPDAQSVKLYRLHNPDTEHYLYTSEASHGHGFEFDGVAARVFETRQPSTVPLYHIYNPATHNNFYTRDERERDVMLRANDAYMNAGVAAYIFPRRICESKPLFRLVHPGRGSHFYTTDLEEGNDAMENEGYTDPIIAGFVVKV
ncbi:hypothetical protein C8R43DRAFT_643055 [Mycena crocata]|nr:hypothetical protein C8R43DRAFT_643055 [Mycena crocata]